MFYEELKRAFVSKYLGFFYPFYPFFGSNSILQNSFTHNATIPYVPQLALLVVIQLGEP